MKATCKLAMAMAILAAGWTAPAQILQSSHQPTVQVARNTRPAPLASQIVALVNGVAITQGEFDQEMRRIFPYFSIHGNEIPKEYVNDVRTKAINNLIDVQLAYQEAKRRKLQITPAEWHKRIAEIRREYRSQAEFNAAVTQLFGSRQAFEDKLREDLLLDKIFQLEVKDKVTVSDADVRGYYQANQAQLVQPESVSFQTISAMFPKTATAADKDAARKRLEKVLPQAQAAKSYDEFGVLAEKVSEDEYRVMMGDHKMEHRSSIAPEFQFLLRMKDGETSGIFASAAGYHVARVYKHTSRRQMTLAELRVSIREQLMSERLNARNKAFHDALRKSAKVQIL